jgi:hypothetical protein
MIEQISVTKIITINVDQAGLRLAASADLIAGFL